MTTGRHLPDLRIGRQSAGFVSRGHPWVRRDRFTGDLAGLTAGTAVTLVDERGHRLASALVDPAAPVCARVYHRLADRAFDPSAALRRAWERRTALHADPATDCYRVVHGEADFLPGLIVERLAGTLVATLRTAALLAHLPAITTELGKLLSGATVLVREHLDDLRRQEVRIRHADGRHADPEAEIVGRELGVPVLVRPAGGLATGLYVDQRANRQALRALAAGRRVLNLFAYTGVFSSSLLAAGAASAVDVDLSEPALDTARRNAALGGVADRHRAVCADCRAFLAGSAETWDLVICDPPTAAQGAGGWVARRDYADLLRHLAPRLAPGAALLACVNTLGERLDLGPMLKQTLPDATALDAPALGEDLPQLKGFPEGLPFRSWLVRRPG